MTTKQKEIVVIGDLHGQWDLLHNRLPTILKGLDSNFSCLFLVGTVFGPQSHGLDSFISGAKKFSLPVYFIAGEETYTDLIDGLPDGGEVAPGITYLGRFGIKEVEGLKVCFLSGIFEEKLFLKPTSAKKYSPHYTAFDLKRVKVSFKDIDVLLTSEWPTMVQKNIIEMELPTLLRTQYSTIGNEVVQNLANKCAPRSHFAAREKIFFTPRAYRNHEHPQTTNFVALAKFNNSQNQRYLHASKIVRMEGLPEAEVRRQGTILEPRACPYPAPESKRRKILSQSGKKPPRGYICGLCGREGSHWFRACSRYKEPSEYKRLQGQVYGSGEPDNLTKQCGYCFHSQGVAKHLIISIGLHCYLTLSRTPVVPDHLFIVPNTHVRSSAELNENQRKELDMYIHALSRCFHPQVLLVFERNIKLQKHSFIEIVPISRGQLPSLTGVIGHFERQRRVKFIKVDQDVDLREMIGQYGFLSMATNEGERYLHVVDPTKPKIRMDMLRRMVCKVMGFPDAYDYTKQRISKADHIKIVATLKDKFSPFDPFTEKQYNIPSQKNKLLIRKQVVEIDESQSK